METLKVTLPGRSYEILIGGGLLDGCGARIRAVTGAETAAVVTDSNVAPLYLRQVEESLRAAGFAVFSVVFPAGEQNALSQSAEYALRALCRGGHHPGRRRGGPGRRRHRRSCGLCRGYHVPGHGLYPASHDAAAQVDSSVGGKTAVDLPQGKNLVGAFHQPKLVLSDTDCLRTLSRRVLCDGMAEVIKYGMIASEALLGRLENLRGPEDLPEHWDRIVYECCDIKRAVVAEDERDTGRRGILNFGHTLGHAYERAYHYETYTHGEAVAAGMVKMLELEEKQGRDTAALRRRLTALLRKFELPAGIPCSMADYREAVGLDKKAKGRKISVIEVETPGRAEIVPMEKEILFALLEETL